ncbi:MAG: hypothetical protein ACO20F_07490 [Robiginitalea sp.]|jgi:hypothetical protein
MKRRTFVIYTGVGVAAISLPIGCYQFQVPPYDPLITEPELLSHIWDAEEIEKAGALYREQFSEEDSEGQLVLKLLENADGKSPEGSVLQQKIVQDFEKGDTVMVDGWILSRTEARQCALFSLTQTR